MDADNLYITHTETNTMYQYVPSSQRYQTAKAKALVVNADPKFNMPVAAILAALKSIGAKSNDF
jgi:hypothetical protein